MNYNVFKVHTSSAVGMSMFLGSLKPNFSTEMSLIVGYGINVVTSMHSACLIISVIGGRLNDARYYYFVIEFRVLMIFDKYGPIVENIFDI